MTRTLAAAAVAAALTLGAGAAAAQVYSGPYPAQPYSDQRVAPPPYGAGPSITFYEGDNFTGREVVIYGEERDFSRIGFNDRARSARTNGSFLVCEDREFRGRCERLSGSVRSLAVLGMSSRISSARDERSTGAGGGYGGGYEDDVYGDEDRFEDRPGRGGAYGNPRRDGVEGRTVVFFARPSVSGNDVAARGQASADQFCRASGHGPAVYYAQGERSRRAVDQDGRLVDAPALRDVLCRTGRGRRGGY
jgi:hypothetical protein